jgi:hypothetical protein
MWKSLVSLRNAVKYRETCFEKARSNYKKLIDWYSLDIAAARQQKVFLNSFKTKLVGANEIKEYPYTIPQGSKIFFSPRDVASTLTEPVRKNIQFDVYEKTEIVVAPMTLALQEYQCKMFESRNELLTEKTKLAQLEKEFEAMNEIEKERCLRECIQAELILNQHINVFKKETQK